MENCHRAVVYPGSFDPFTYGHKDILERALRVFENVIVAVVRNPGKTPLFTLEERVSIIKDSINHNPNVIVESFDGLLVDFMRKKGVKVLVKGLRAVSDFEFEFQMALMNRKLDPEIETVFLMTSTEYAFLSSSRVKELASLGAPVDSFVSPFAEKMLRQKFINCTLKGENVEKE